MFELSLDNYSLKIKSALESSVSYNDIFYIQNKLIHLNRLCWLSGGAVRDLMIGLEPFDFDLTTDATEDEILACFPNAILVGRQFGVYKIPLNQSIYDLTVFREETDYTDGRRPNQVIRSTPEKDALRRDFTVNALFYDLKNELVIDYVNGLGDLRSQLLKCVGNAFDRFNEDYLRLLRFSRFKHQLNFSVSLEDYEVALGLAHLAHHISGERISSEISKLKIPEQRKNFYSDQLTIGILQHNKIFLQLNNLDEIKFSSFNLSDLWVFEIFFLTGINENHLNAIVSTFKVSNKIKNSFNLLMKLVMLHQQNIEHKIKHHQSILALDGKDQSGFILDLMYYFSYINRIELQSLTDAMKKFLRPLITAKDIMHIKDKTKISELLKQARAWQIENSSEDFQACYDYIISKYRILF